MDSCEWSDWSDEELSTFDNLEENACNTSEANSRKQNVEKLGNHSANQSDDPETREPPDDIETRESPDDPQEEEPPEDPETRETREQTDEPETSEHREQTDDPEASEHREQTDDPEAKEPREDPQTREPREQTDEPETREPPEKTDDTEAIEPRERTDDPEARKPRDQTDDTETREPQKQTEDTETREPHENQTNDSEASQLSVQKMNSSPEDFSSTDEDVPLGAIKTHHTSTRILSGADISLAPDTEMDVPLSNLKSKLQFTRYGKTFIAKDTDLPTLKMKRESQNNDSTTDTDMNVPLLYIKNKLHNLRPRDRTPSPMYDSDLDQTYVPNIKDINSSDSEDNIDLLPDDPSSSESEVLFQSPKKKRKVVRRLIESKIKKSCKILGQARIKRSDHTISNQQIENEQEMLTQPSNKKRSVKNKTLKDGNLKKKIKSQQKQSSNQLGKHNKIPKSPCGFWKVVNESRRQMQARLVTERYHEQKIDKLLASNRLERRHVYPDGNCLLNAVLQQLNTDKTIQSLRKEICDHIVSNIQHYIAFVRTDDNTQVDARTKIEENVNKLGENGHWSSEYADFVPLCLANIFRRKIRIFSTRMFAPIFEVEPDLFETEDGKDILLAHLAIPRAEHYDPVYKKSEQTETEKTVEQGKSTPKRKRNADTAPILTPHKETKFVSPKRKQCFRKRKSNPDNWKANKRKKMRSLGMEYTSKTGTEIPSRKLKPKDCSKCRFKCSSKILEENRNKIFNLYWKLGDYEKQRGFICSNIKSQESKRIQSEYPRRKKSVAYFLRVHDEQFRVCKDFFLATLDIGSKTVESAIKKMVHGVFAGKDMRGKKAPANKTPTADENFVHEHIASFPVIESHYTRKDTKRQYLAQDLNIKKMYELYKAKCTETGRKPVKQTYYRNIFNTHFNFSFFQPKKDQCSTCVLHDQNVKDGTLTDEMKNNYDNHQKRKEDARDEKTRDKQKAASDKSVQVATFDLQAVLSVPCSLVGDLYYKRKLSCYNLSFYNLGNRNGHCFLWDETHGGRGSCEIGTCIYCTLTPLLVLRLYMKSLCTLTHVEAKTETSTQRQHCTTQLPACHI